MQWPTTRFNWCYSVRQRCAPQSLAHGTITRRKRPINALPTVVSATVQLLSQNTQCVRPIQAQGSALACDGQQHHCQPTTPCTDLILAWDSAELYVDWQDVLGAARPTGTFSANGKRYWTTQQLVVIIMMTLMMIVIMSVYIIHTTRSSACVGVIKIANNHLVSMYMRTCLSGVSDFCKNRIPYILFTREWHTDLKKMTCKINSSAVYIN